MRYRIATTTLLAVALLSTATANAQSSIAPGHDHGAHHVEAGPSTMNISIAPNRGLKVGEPATFTLLLTTENGKPVIPADLQLAHTEKVHLLIVDPSLTDYHHAHPQPDNKPGTYTFTLTPNKAGEYKVFADLLPVATNKQEYATTTFTVTGTSAAVEKVVSKMATVDGYTFTLKFETEPPTAGQPNRAWVTVTGADGKPFEQLEPVMGAFAHTVGFSEDRAEIVHLHPLGKEPETAQQRGGPTLEFHIDVATGGYKKLFTQVQIGGKPVFAPFGIDVLAVKSGQNTHAGGHGHDEPVIIPATVDTILAAVDQRVAAIDQAIVSGELAKVHNEAFAARDLLAALPGKVDRLGAAEAKALDAAIGRIRQQAALLDKFGDAGDAAQTRTVLTRFKQEIAHIRQQIAGKAGGHTH